MESHYRYYQFYANTLVAVVWAYCVYRWTKSLPIVGFGSDLGVLLLCGVLFAGSRDALSKYRNRIRQLSKGRMLQPDEGDAMTNGIDHNQGNAGTSATPATTPAPKGKPDQSSQPQPTKDGPRVQGHAVDN